MGVDGESQVGRRPKTLVTMSDVAREAGVSVKTVSNVVNDFIHVKPSTRDRVQKAIDKLGYQMNLPAQNLRRGRSGAIGLAVPFLVNPYFAEIVQVATQQAESRGFKMFLELTGGLSHGEIGVLTAPLRSMTDGLILALTGLRHDQDEPRLAVDYPLVVLGDQLFGTSVTQVTMSNVEGAKAATEYLIDRGARRIALLGWHPDRTATSELRFEGYLEALEARGIAFDQDLILVEDDWTRRHGAERLEEAIDSGLSFDAVFAMNDILAIGALQALRGRGISVPDQVQVIGWDDLDEGQYTTPTLTTLDPSVAQIAIDAVDLLIAEINDQSGQLGHSRTVEPFSIVERNSTRKLSTSTESRA